MGWDFGYDGGAGQLWFDRIVAFILWWKFIRDLHKIMAQDYHMYQLKSLKPNLGTALNKNIHGSPLLGLHTKNRTEPDYVQFK